MNNVVLIGRLTRDPELRYTAGSQTAVATFTVAVDRGKDKNGESRGADFPRVIVFGRSAENCEKYLAKGRLVGVQGRLQTGSYTNKKGATVYTTDVVADRVEFLERGDKHRTYTPEEIADTAEKLANDLGKYMTESTPSGFSAVDEEIPF
ncbi:MAG: single-stranded DNA-binding protein [Anaerovoracaceae bacterium]